MTARAVLPVAALPGDALSGPGRLALAALLATADDRGCVSSLDADALALLGLTGPTTPDRLARLAHPLAASASASGLAWVDLPAVLALAHPAALAALQEEGATLAAACAAVRLSVAAADLATRRREHRCPPSR